MIGPKLEKHLASAHPDDCVNLEEVRIKLQTLLDLRLESGVTERFISLSLGHRHAFMSQVREPFTSNGHGWLFNSFHDLAVGVLAVPRLKVYGLDGVTSPLWEMSRSNTAYLGVGAQEVLDRYRRKHRVTKDRMAELMQLHRSAIYRLEKADNPYMGTLQRTARALGLVVKFDVVKTWTTGGQG